MEKLGTALGVIVLLLIVAVLLAFPIMWLWNNCLVPAMPLALAKIGFWQALGIKILFGLLSYSSSQTSKKE